MNNRLIVILMPMLFMSACTIGPSYVAPDIASNVQFSDIVEKEFENIDSDAEVDTTWWERFEDPVLNNLIGLAKLNSTDIRLALFQVEEARSNRAIVQAARRPFLSSTAAATRQQSSENAIGFGPPPGFPSLQNLFDLSVNFNWEIDVFNRLSRIEDVASLRVEASLDDRKAVMVAVFAEVGIAYAQLRGLQMQYDIAGQNIELVQRTVELTRLLVDQGVSPEFDLVRARANLHELIARRNQIIAQQHAAAAQIAFLTGQQPASVLDDLLVTGAQLIPSARIPVGLPSDLLLRRPDIRAAERRLAAASVQIGIEQVDLFPRFSLTGVAGFRAANVEDLLDSGSEVWSVGGAASWPILNRGQERAEIDIARSRFGAAGAEYEATVLAAFQEVETTLASYVYSAKELDGLVEAQKDRQRAYDLALLRYQSNIDALFPALDAGLLLTALNSEIAAKRQELLVAQINVYRALGGGWQQYEE